MPIQSVKKDYEQLRYHSEVDLRTAQESRYAPRIFTVTFTPGEEPAERIVLAATAEDSAGNKIPAVWERHPADDWLFVQSVDVEHLLGPYTYRVTVNYTSIGNPLELEAEKEWSFAVSNEPVDRDNKGVPVTNSAAESFDTPLTKDVYDLILRIKKNQETFNELLATKYIGAVNGDQWQPPGSNNSYPPGFVKCTRFDATPQKIADLDYYQVNYEFQFRLGEIIWLSHNQWLTTGVGWKRRILDEGYRILVLENGQWTGEFEDILDKNETKVRAPVLLDGQGQKLLVAETPGEDEEGNALHNRFKGVFLVWDLDKKMPFSDLMLT